MISNLLINSIYALSAGGTVYIDVRDSETEPQGVAFTIQDNGVGIGPEDLPRVFDAFFTTRAMIGTGIGLFIAKQLVEGHSGRITVESAGHGMNDEALRHLFEPFYSTKGDLGNGLGFYISNVIVERHGGSLIVKSQIDVGTEIRVRLPRRPDRSP